MFGGVKNYLVLLGILLLLVNCAPVGPTGETAASQPAGDAGSSNVCGNDATVETPQKDVSVHTLENYGELKVVKPAAEEIVANQPFEISFTFTANQTIAPITEGGNTHDAIIRVLFGERGSNIAYRRVTKAGSEFTSTVQDNEDHSMIYLNEMQEDDSFSMTFTVTPESSFPFDVTIVQDGSPISFFGSAQRIEVTPMNISLPPTISYCDSEESKQSMRNLYSNQVFNAKEYSNTKGKITVTTTEDHVYANEKNTLSVKFTALRSVSKGERINVVFPKDNFELHIEKLARSANLVDDGSFIKSHYRLGGDGGEHVIYAIFLYDMSAEDNFTINFPFTARSGSRSYRVESEIGRSGSFKAFKSSENHPAVMVIPEKCR